MAIFNSYVKLPEGNQVTKNTFYMFVSRVSRVSKVRGTKTKCNN